MTLHHPFPWHLYDAKMACLELTNQRTAHADKGISTPDAKIQKRNLLIDMKSKLENSIIGNT
jgi:hypothetical protein